MKPPLILTAILGVLTRTTFAQQRPQPSAEDTSAFPSTSKGDSASAEAFMGTVVMPAALPPTFPLEEFTDYGVQGRFAPSAYEADDFIPGSVPVNAYRNPTTGMAEDHNRYHGIRPSVSVGGVGGSPFKESSWSGSMGGGGRGSPIDRLDPIDYFDYPEDDMYKFTGKDREGTLHSALQTLWNHRSGAYSSFEDNAPSSSNDVWFDSMPHQTHRSDSTKSSSVNSQENISGSNPSRDQSHVSSSHGTKTRQRLRLGSSNRRRLTPANRARNPSSTYSRPVSGQSLHTSGNQGRRTITLNQRHQTRPRTPAKGLPAKGQVGQRDTVRVPFVDTDAKNKRPPIRRPGMKVGGVRRIGSSPSGNSQVFRYPAGNQRPSKGQRFQMVRNRYPVGRVGAAANTEENSFSVRQSSDEDYDYYDYYDYMDYPDYDRKTGPLPIRPSSSSGMRRTSSGNRGQISLEERVMNQEAILRNQLRKQANIEMMNQLDMNQLAELQELSLTETEQEGKTDWMTQVSDAMSEVSNQLPSIEKAVTTMSFLAFGIFMTNLLVQAVANSSTLTSVFGREEKSDDLAELQLELKDLLFNLEDGSWKVDPDDEDSLSSFSVVKQLLKVAGQVYLSLHEIARSGIYNAVSALGIGIPGNRIPLGADELEPECLRRLLCEGHHITSPYYKGVSSYKLLPFWTVGVSWLSGNSNVPRLLEELRAEVAGQKGLPCAKVYPDCKDENTLNKYLDKIRADIMDPGDLMNSDTSAGRSLGNEDTTDESGSSINSNHNNSSRIQNENQKSSQMDIRSNSEKDLIPSEVTKYVLEDEDKQ